MHFTSRWLSPVVAFCAAAAWPLANAVETQAPRDADWLTDGGDPQRTAWRRHETILTKDTSRT